MEFTTVTQESVAFEIDCSALCLLIVEVKIWRGKCAALASSFRANRLGS